jgi:hypothetical protein
LSTQNGYIDYHDNEREYEGEIKTQLKDVISKEILDSMQISLQD